MISRHVLVAGVGNVFLGDDAFGVEVARRLMRRECPEGVCVDDFGIRGLDLAYALLDGYDVAIIVDATPRGGPPGALYIIEPDAGSPAGDSTDDLAIEAHSMDPAKVLRLATRMGSRPAQVILVGCEPTTLVSDDGIIVELSAPVAEAVNEAEKLIAQLIEQAITCESLQIPGSTSGRARHGDRPEGDKKWHA